MIVVGPAGWSYPDWEGRVYPRPKPSGFHPLAYLAGFFDCIEVNSTFYALPRAANVARWVELVRPFSSFRFLVKLHQDFSHGPAPESPEPWEAAAASFRAGIAPLVGARRLAGLLLQFPASFRRTPRAVQRLGRVRGLFAEERLVLEVRHRSWFEPPALDEIRGLRYSLAHIDLPQAWDHPPEGHAPTGPIGYLRLHGRNSEQWFRRAAPRDDRYDYLYSTSELGELAERARAIAGECDETYVVTNNHFAGQAVANALELRYLLEQKRPAAPAPLVRAFPRLAPLTHSVGQSELFD